MVRTLEAVYEDGVLRPLEPLSLRERQQVRLTLDDQTPPLIQTNSLDPQKSPDRREEMLWLANQSASYAGQWVALSGSCLVSYGTDPAIVRAAARAAGVQRPLLPHLPEKADLPFGGW